VKKGTKVQHAGPSKRIQERAQLLEWLAQPDFLRQPRTQQELAVVLKVDAPTLSDWKREPGFMDRVVARVNELAREAHPDVMNALRSNIRGGDTQAIKLYLEYVQQWAPRTKLDATVTENLSKLSDEELDERIAARAKQFLADRKRT
jgi:hypothetical protein